MKYRATQPHSNCHTEQSKLTGIGGERVGLVVGRFYWLEANPKGSSLESSQHYQERIKK